MGAGTGKGGACCKSCDREAWVSLSSLDDQLAINLYTGGDFNNGSASYTRTSMPADQTGEEINYPLTKAFVDEGVGIEVAVVNGVVVVTRILPGELVDRTNMVNQSSGPQGAFRTLRPRDVILSVNNHACVAKEIINEMRTQQMLCFQVLKLSLVQVEQTHADTCSYESEAIPLSPGGRSSASGAMSPGRAPPWAHGIPVSPGGRSSASGAMSPGRAVPWAHPPAADDRSESSRYTSIQFLAYEICTAPPGLGVAGDGTQQFHLGIAGDLVEDMQHRLELLSAAMDQCCSCGDVDHSAETLKVFMAPEMFFRGTVDPRDSDAVLQALNKVWYPGWGDPKFADWLCVFGTVVGRDAVDIRSPDDEECIVYNMVPVKLPRQHDLVGVLRQYKYKTALLADPQLGGLATGDMKRFMSLAKNARITSKRKGLTPIVRDGLFTVEGITFGHENTLDHARKSVKRLGGAQSVRVQLLGTFASDARPDAIVVSEGGYVFQCDGGAGSPAEGFGAKSKLMRQMNEGRLEVVPCCKRSAVHGTHWKEVLGSRFADTATPPTVVVYPSMPVPRSNVSPRSAPHPAEGMPMRDFVNHLVEGYTCNV